MVNVLPGRVAIECIDDGLLEAATVAGAWDVLHGRPIDFGATWRLGGMWVLVLIVALVIPRALTQLGVPPFSALRPLCSLAWAAVIVPFRSALAARVYLEIRIRKEGYDLQHMMASLPSAA